jgi:hypothetical protein
MEPVPNREFLLEYINAANRINNHIINIMNNNVIDYNNAYRNEVINNIIYMNHLNNNYIYNYSFQAAGVQVQPIAASESVASALSTFERLNIEVEDHVVVPPSQAPSSSRGDGDDACCCSICLNSEEEEKENKEEEKENKEEEKKMVKTKCAHIFHSECLAKWVIQKTTCPMCRNSLIKKIT